MTSSLLHYGMRKNLTISLSSEDWSLVRQAVRSMGETYSGLFHRLIQAALAERETDPKVTAKYRPLFKREAAFLAQRAAAMARASRKKGPRS